MLHKLLPKAVVATVFAMCASMTQAVAGEATPGLGLEVYDTGPGPYTPPPSVGYTLPQQGGYVAVPNAESTDTVIHYDPGAFTARTRPPAATPALPDEVMAVPQQPVQPYEQPSEQVVPLPLAQEPFAEPEPAPAAAQAEAAYVYDTVEATLADLNVANRDFPGLADAQARGSLRMAANVIWPVLRNRRVVQYTLERGPRGSVATASPIEFQLAFEAINFIGPPDDIMLAADRIDVILNALASPVVDHPNMGQALEGALLRLHTDIVAVRAAMDATDGSQAVYQRLLGAYLRASTTCDYFVFSRQEMADIMTRSMTRAGSLFYPDGASVAGDVAGVSGGMFMNLLVLDGLNREQGSHRRNARSGRAAMEKPVRFLAGVALPNGQPPQFGPRSQREPGPEELRALEAMYPQSAYRVNRIGLASSNSFPESSADASFGGIFAMRSGFDPGARYLAVRFGPAGALAGAPIHQDFGSLVIASRGTAMVQDPGGYDGPAATAPAHNTISLNGQYAVPESYGVPGQPVQAVWRTNAGLDYAAGLAAFPDGKTWQRGVVFAKNLPGEDKGEFFLILDHIVTNGDNQPAEFQARYHLASGIQSYHDGSGILASTGVGDGSGLRFFSVDANARLDTYGGAAAGQLFGQGVALTRTIVGDTTTATVIYPSEGFSHKPARIDRDSDIITGKTGALIIDHGNERIDVVAWAQPGQDLVTPTLNLQMSADLGVFRLRKGKLVRMHFVNLERFNLKEPDGGAWSMRVNGNPQTLTLEPEASGGWQVLSDPANVGAATLSDVSFGPAIAKRRFSIRPGEMKVVIR